MKHRGAFQWCTSIIVRIRENGFRRNAGPEIRSSAPITPITPSAAVATRGANRAPFISWFHVWMKDGNPESCPRSVFLSGAASTSVNRRPFAYGIAISRPPLIPTDCSCPRPKSYS